jgi:hypothetical protein
VDEVVESDHAGVVELEQVVELAVGAFGVDEVLKGVDDLLDGDYPPRPLMATAENHPVSALADLVLDLVILVDLVVELLRLFHSEIIIKPSIFKNTQRMTSTAQPILLLGQDETWGMPVGRCVEDIGSELESWMIAISQIGQCWRILAIDGGWRVSYRDEYVR